MCNSLHIIIIIIIIFRCVILSCLLIVVFVTPVARCSFHKDCLVLSLLCILRELRRIARGTFVNYMVVIDCYNALAHIPILLQML